MNLVYRKANINDIDDIDDLVDFKIKQNIFTCNREGITLPTVLNRYKTV